MDNTHVAEFTNLIMCTKGDEAIISRMPCIPTGVPFQFSRLEFAICVSFAMSISESQEKTFKDGGKTLTYVERSRTEHKKKSLIYSLSGKTKMIVYYDRLIWEIGASYGMLKGT